MNPVPDNTVQTQTSATAQSPRYPWCSTLGLIGLAASLILGGLLRLGWSQDIEYKLDEYWTFEKTQHIGVTEPLPWTGMPTSAGFANPGMSVWVFALLAKVFGAHDPAALARAIQICNVLALVLLVGFAFRFVPEKEREPWLWAAALAAVCPLEVLFHRKIWPPSALPLLMVLMLVGWWRRERQWGACLWGLAAVCAGQIHLTGFFILTAFALWAFFFQRGQVAWPGLFIGCFLAALPLIPWLMQVRTEPLPERHSSFIPLRLLEGKFWSHWATEPLGIGLKYSLGDDFPDFLRYPLIHGQSTYLVAILHQVLMVLGLVILGRGLHRLWLQRWRGRELWIGTESATAFTQNAALWGFGLLLTLPGLPFHRHYLIVTFPLMFVWLARFTLGSTGNFRLGRTLLVLLFSAELLISANFLHYIHVNQRFIIGDYRVPYGAQKILLKTPHS